MNLSEDQKLIISKFEIKSPHIDNLKQIPEQFRDYKCFKCNHIVSETPCPICGADGESVAIMCPLDHCHCSHEIISGIEYCPICGEPICPDCGSHDVFQISRVKTGQVTNLCCLTGYLQEVSGFNAGKQAELKDRKRYNPSQLTV